MGCVNSGTCDYTLKDFDDITNTQIAADGGINEVVCDPMGTAK